VTVEGQLISEIRNGILVLLGIEEADGEEDIIWLSKKIVNLRIFNDGDGVMNRSLLQEDGDVLVVSQFTLHAAIKKGNRPSYIKAARPELAIPLYERFVRQMELDLGKKVGTGGVVDDMNVSLVNKGAVTRVRMKNNEE